MFVADTSVMLRSALPFGTSLICLLLLACSVLGLFFLLAGWKWQIRFLRRFGAALAIVGVGVLTVDGYFNALMEWNPSIADDATVVGTWADERETITLHVDHRVDYHSWNEGFSGTWSREDWNLRLLAEGVDSRMRFIVFDGELRLMTNPPDDPDEWNGDLGAQRKAVMPDSIHHWPLTTFRVTTLPVVASSPAETAAVVKVS